MSQPTEVPKCLFTLLLPLFKQPLVVRYEHISEEAIPMKHSRANYRPRDTKTLVCPPACLCSDLHVGKQHLRALAWDLL